MRLHMAGVEHAGDVRGGEAVKLIIARSYAFEGDLPGIENAGLFYPFREFKTAKWAMDHNTAEELAQSYEGIRQYEVILDLEANTI